MNEISLFGSDLLFIVCAVVVSFVLGTLHRLRRTIARQRRVVELTDREVRDLSAQCAHQQMNVSRLHQELSELRQALMQQAFAPAQVTAPAERAQPRTEAAHGFAPAASARAAPARRAQPADPPARSTSNPVVDPIALARAGESAEVLMQRCSLSRAEAALVISVHGRRARAAA